MEKSKIILIEKSNRREIDFNELSNLKEQANQAKNGLSVMFMKEMSDKEGCSIYRLVHKFAE